MKNYLLSLLITGIVVTPLTVLGQAKSFEGFSGGVNLNLVGTSTNLTVNDVSVHAGDQSVIPSLDLGYTYAIDDKFTIGVSGTYDLSKSKAGQISSTFELEGKDHYSINLKPGFAIADNILVYGLFGYHNLTGSITNTTGTTTFSGFGYGLGSQIMIDKNLYLKLEIQQIAYGSEATFGTALDVKPSATVGAVGIGYKF